MRGRDVTTFLSTGRRHEYSNVEDLRARRAMEAAEKERQRMERERAFDAGLIRLESFIAPGARSIELVSHPEEIKGNGESNKVVQPSRDIDLNMPFVGDN